MTRFEYSREISSLERERWGFMFDGMVLLCTDYERLRRASTRHTRWTIVACSGSGRRQDPGYTEDAPLPDDVAVLALNAFRASLTISTGRQRT